jgi:hypothetical protein
MRVKTDGNHTSTKGNLLVVASLPVIQRITTGLVMEANESGNRIPTVLTEPTT